ncbi:cation/H(+) antiporter, partial [Halomonas sp. ND22Bw]|uniref:cation:proton antiporter domain-containing protein n=1 Tax=Halomonas sp. ND22Bw TaxID=2054178 RepID=UPI000D2B4612
RLGVVVIMFMASAWAMDAVGVHAVFGGFILGVVMPRGLLAQDVRRQLEPLVVLLLLPMFFTFSGLNTQLTLVDNLGLVAVTG